MSASQPVVGEPTGRTKLVVDSAVVLLVGTLVSFGVGFGVLTDCTNATAAPARDAARAPRPGRG